MAPLPRPPWCLESTKYVKDLLGNFPKQKLTCGFVILSENGHFLSNLVAVSMLIFNSDHFMSI